MYIVFKHLVDTEKTPENLQTELINLQCGTNLTTKLSETQLQDIYSYLPKDKFPQLRSLGLRMITEFRSTYMCRQFFSLMKNNKTKSRLY
jgi:hypothetical protein